MKYAEIGGQLQRFEAVRAACSREWEISSDLVMCTELDLSNYCGMPVSPRATFSPGEPPFMVISFCRLTAQDPRVWVVGARVQLPAMTAQERARAAARFDVIRRWADGRLDALPPSTSTRVRDQLRGQRR